jgi:hypothetical protein
MRRAISPRLAMTTLSSMAGLFDDQQRLVVFNRLAVLDQDAGNGAGVIGLDLVEHFHRFDDANRVADVDLLADFDERFGAGRGGTVERADHRRAQDMALDRFRSLRKRGGLRCSAPAESERAWRQRGP